MITALLVTVGIPTLFLAVRLLLHALAPNSYGPAGGHSVYSALVAGLLYVFGFIVAAALGVTAGSADLSEGTSRHLVVTGRSRLALYLARIPAGLAIIVPLVAEGFTIVCLVRVLAAPKQLAFNGVKGRCCVGSKSDSNVGPGRPIGGRQKPQFGPLLLSKGLFRQLVWCVSRPASP